MKWGYPYLAVAAFVFAGVSGCGPTGGPPEESAVESSATEEPMSDTTATDAPPGQSEPENDGE